ncbi:MAG: ABC transporter ATP-binding protein [Thermodesulfobacteriota bacterium]
MEPPPIIKVSGLTKAYGPLQALQEVHFTVGPGDILAYLGPNGAGKTTTIRILSGLLDRDAGEVEICGRDVAVEPVAVKRLIGVVPDASNLYPELSCRRNLEYLGELYGLSRPRRQARAGELLDLFELGDRATAPFGNLSRGLKRRLTIAAALMHDPEVLFLDEPTTGLDVLSARTLRDLIRFINGQGTTVFLTTHNLQEAEALCRQVVILIKGRVVAQGTAATIRERVRRLNLLEVALAGQVTAEQLRRACPGVLAATPHDQAWRLEVADVHAALAQLLAFSEAAGLRLEAVNSTGASLEDAFLEILQENLNKPEAIP